MDSIGARLGAGCTAGTDRQALSSRQRRGWHIGSRGATLNRNGRGGQILKSRTLLVVGRNLG
jgi:hypothetical protein